MVQAKKTDTTTGMVSNKRWHSSVQWSGTINIFSNCKTYLTTCAVCVPNLVFSSMRARVRFSRGRLFLAAAVVAAAAPFVAAPVVAASKWPADFVLRWSTVPSSTKGIDGHGSSVTDPWCSSRNPDPNFFHPRIPDTVSKRFRIQCQKDSGSASKNLSILTQKIVLKLSEIWSGMFQSGIGILFFHPSRIQGSKRHRNPDPDPQHGHERMEKKQNKCGKFPSSVSQPVFFLFFFSSPFPHKYTQPLMLAAVNKSRKTEEQGRGKNFYVSFTCKRTIWIMYPPLPCWVRLYNVL